MVLYRLLLRGTLFWCFYLSFFSKKHYFMEVLIPLSIVNLLSCFFEISESFNCLIGK